ncbi:hypothetical protein BDV40DRAFT_260450 [Aspergillus tamarii]|uniref:Uncharacterized protein n=1 Tax=Aspergillus tamarii TaxID=41984 RepID=A0A5N6V1U9_ASPTM|nr:hypothetical protein BDV40DRAFT_260450 [Aspergillus tamarii]
MADQISAVLSLKSVEAPLRPLNEWFRTKYLLFAVYSNGLVCYGSSEALNISPKRQQQSTTNQQERETIQPGGYEIIRIS